MKYLDLDHCPKKSTSFLVLALDSSAIFLFAFPRKRFGFELEVSIRALFVVAFFLLFLSSRALFPAL